MHLKAVAGAAILLVACQTNPATPAAATQHTDILEACQRRGVDGTALCGDLRGLGRSRRPGRAANQPQHSCAARAGSAAGIGRLRLLVWRPPALPPQIPPGASLAPGSASIRTSC